jgi:hypothetical protein
MITEADASPEDSAKAKRAAHLRRLNADLAFGALLMSRGYSAESIEKMAPNHTKAQSILEQLYQGVRILDLDDVITAGVPSTTDIGKQRLMSTMFNPLFGIWGDSPFWNYPYTYGYGGWW